MRKNLAMILATLLLFPALAACGGDDDDDPSGNSPFGDDRSNSGDSTNIKGKGECEVTVTGDVETSWEADGGADAVGSDYWLSDDELRTALEFLASGSGDEKKKEVDEAMKADPRFFILLVNCIPDDETKGSLTLSPSSEAKYGDIPFKPGDYVIAQGGVFGSAEDPKEFSVLLSTDEESVWKVSEDGTLKITKWDNSGLKGNFSFKAEEAFAAGATPKKISVSGSFDFPCAGGEKCKN